MQQRHSFSGPEGGLVRWSARHVLSWIVLIVMVLTSAYGLYGLVAAIAPTASAASVPTGVRSPAVNDDVLFAPRGLPPDLSAAS